MAYSVEIEPAADRQLSRVPRQHQPRIAEKIDALAGDPRPVGCEKLAGMENAWRIRIGEYRVVYTVDDGDEVVLVTRVGHRSQVYRRKR